MKGQIEPLTTVMITGMIVASVGTIYVWGTPLLEKRQTESELSGLENQLIELQRTFNEVERGGQGATENVDLDLSDEGELLIDADSNLIRIETLTEENIYAQDTQFTLAGNNVTRQGTYNGESLFYGIEGVAQPSQLNVETQSASEGSSLIIYQIKLNNVFTNNIRGDVLKVRDIEVRGNSNTQRSTGETSITITNDGESVEESAATLNQGVVDVQNQQFEINLQ